MEGRSVAAQPAGAELLGGHATGEAFGENRRDKIIPGHIRQEALAGGSGELAVGKDAEGRNIENAGERSQHDEAVMKMGRGVEGETGGGRGGEGETERRRDGGGRTSNVERKEGEEVTVGEGAENARDGEPAEGAAEDGVREGEGEGEVAEDARGECGEENCFEGGGAATGEAAAPDLGSDAGAREDEALPEEDGESDEQRPVGHGGRWAERARAMAGAKAALEDPSVRV